ncbi:MAG: hypothetical protein ABIR30_03445 [Chitinophagaceae bacterium]
MKHRTGLLILGLIVLLAAACSKGGVPYDDSNDGGAYVYNAGDTTAPVLNIYTPVDNQVYTNGNAINVTGRITDDAGLYRGKIRIINDATGSILKEQQYEIHGIATYNFNISYTTAVTSPADYTVTVSFEDHGLNSATKSVKVKVNP